MVGVDFEGLSILGNRLVQLSFLREGHSQVALGVHIVRVELQGFSKLLNRFVRLPILEQSEPEIVVTHPRIRVLGQRVAPECLVAIENRGPLPTCHPQNYEQSSAKGRLQPWSPRDNIIRGPCQRRAGQSQRSHARQILEMIKDQGITKNKSVNQSQYRQQSRHEITESKKTGA